MRKEKIVVCAVTSLVATVAVNKFVLTTVSKVVSAFKKSKDYDRLVRELEETARQLRQLENEASGRHATTTTISKKDADVISHHIHRQELENAALKRNIKHVNTMYQTFLAYLRSSGRVAEDEIEMINEEIEASFIPWDAPLV